jgi:hypothetical protein
MQRCLHSSHHRHVVEDSAQIVGNGQALTFVRGDLRKRLALSPSQLHHQISAQTDELAAAIELVGRKKAQAKFLPPGAFAHVNKGNSALPSGNQRSNKFLSCAKPMNGDDGLGFGEGKWAQFETEFLSFARHTHHQAGNTRKRHALQASMRAATLCDCFRYRSG